MQSKNWYLSSSAVLLEITLVAVTLASAQSAAPREKILANFSQPGGDAPSGGLIADAAGNLYGTTSFGGSASDGSLFELKPSGGAWTFSIVHSFQNSTTDGGVPDSSLLLDSKGNLFGTTIGGGSSGGGTVFEVTP